MILLLLAFDLDGVVLRLSPLSEDFRGLSDRGDLRESLRGCLTSDALIERGMHFDFPDIDSSSSAESDELQVLAVGICISAQEMKVVNCLGEARVAIV